MIRLLCAALPALLLATAATARSDPDRIAALSGMQIDTTALATVPAAPRVLSDGAAPAAARPMAMRARAERLRPAPLPDPDMDAPGPDAQQIAAQDEASVHPSFYSGSTHFAGDGFAPGSTLESDQNNRRKPGGGMSLSIPMQ